MKNRGISFIGIIVFIGLVALIVWGLNYIITKDYVVVRAPSSPVIENPESTSTLPVAAQNASSTPTTTPAKVTKSNNTTPATQTSTGLAVTFNDKGFSPASLTIKKGQTVTFLNNSSGKMWVSANPFPTAADYPAFNEKTGTDSGSSWSFTFTKTGTWFYHNHYSPAIGAKIIVNAQ